MLSLDSKDFAKLRLDLSRVRKALRGTNYVYKIAADARNIVERRTIGGKAMDGRNFTAYSTRPIYMAKNRRPKPQGGRSKTLGGKPMKTVFYEGGYREFAAATKGYSMPNLFASGDMFRAFQAKSHNFEKATVMFTRQNAALKALGNQFKRPFVGINISTELPILQDTFAKMIDRDLRRHDL